MEDDGTRKGAWTPEEDNELLRAIAKARAGSALGSPPPPVALQAPCKGERQWQMQATHFLTKCCSVHCELFAHAEGRAPAVQSAAGPGVWVLIMLLYFPHLSSALHSAGNPKDALP